MESTRFQRMTFWWSTFQFVLSTVFIVNFLYFALLHKRKVAELGHETRCVAKEGINHPINITNDTNPKFVTDVGQQFFVLFIAGLALNFISAF